MYKLEDQILSPIFFFQVCGAHAHLYLVRSGSLWFAPVSVQSFQTEFSCPVVVSYILFSVGMMNNIVLGGNLLYNKYDGQRTNNGLKRTVSSILRNCTFFA